MMKIITIFFTFLILFIVGVISTINPTVEFSNNSFQPEGLNRNTFFKTKFSSLSTTPIFYPPTDLSQINPVLVGYGWYLGHLSLTSDPDLHFTTKSPVVSCEASYSSPTPYTPWLSTAGNYLTVQAVATSYVTLPNVNAALSSQIDNRYSKSLSFYLIFKTAPNFDLWDSFELDIRCAPQIRVENPVDFNDQRSSFQMSLTAFGNQELVQNYPIPSLSQSSKPTITLLTANFDQSNGFIHSVRFVPPATPPISETDVGLPLPPLDEWAIIDPIIIDQDPYTFGPGFPTPDRDYTNIPSRHIAAVLNELGFDRTGVPCLNSAQDIVGYFRPRSDILNQPMQVDNAYNVFPGTIFASETCVYSFPVSPRFALAGRFNATYEPDSTFLPIQRRLASFSSILGVNGRELPNHVALDVSTNPVRDLTQDIGSFIAPAVEWDYSVVGNPLVYQFSQHDSRKLIELELNSDPTVEYNGVKHHNHITIRSWGPDGSPRHLFDYMLCYYGVTDTGIVDYLSGSWFSDFKYAEKKWTQNTVLGGTGTNNADGLAYSCHDPTNPIPTTTSFPIVRVSPFSDSSKACLRLDRNKSNNSGVTWHCTISLPMVPRSAVSGTPTISFHRYPVDAAQEEAARVAAGLSAKPAYPITLSQGQLSLSEPYSFRIVDGNDRWLQLPFAPNPLKPYEYKSLTMASFFDYTWTATSGVSNPSANRVHMLSASTSIDGLNLSSAQIKPCQDAGLGQTQSTCLVLEAELKVFYPVELLSFVLINSQTYSNNLFDSFIISGLRAKFITSLGGTVQTGDNIPDTNIQSSVYNPLAFNLPGENSQFNPFDQGFNYLSAQQYLASEKLFYPLYDPSGNNWKNTIAHDFVSGVSHFIRISIPLLPIYQQSMFYDSPSTLLAKAQIAFGPMSLLRSNRSPILVHKYPSASIDVISSESASYQSVVWKWKVGRLNKGLTDAFQSPDPTIVFNDDVNLPPSFSTHPKLPYDIIDSIQYHMYIALLQQRVEFPGLSFSIRELQTKETNFYFEITLGYSLINSFYLPTDPIELNTYLERIFTAVSPISSTNQASIITSCVQTFSDNGTNSVLSNHHRLCGHECSPLSCSLVTNQQSSQNYAHLHPSHVDVKPGTVITFNVGTKHLFQPGLVSHATGAQFTQNMVETILVEYPDADIATYFDQIRIPLKLTPRTVISALNRLYVNVVQIPYINSKPQFTFRVFYDGGMVQKPPLSTAVVFPTITSGWDTTHQMTPPTAISSCGRVDSGGKVLFALDNCLTSASCSSTATSILRGGSNECVCDQNTYGTTCTGDLIGDQYLFGVTQKIRFNPISEINLYEYSTLRQKYEFLALLSHPYDPTQPLDTNDWYVRIVPPYQSGKYIFDPNVSILEPISGDVLLVSPVATQLLSHIQNPAEPLQRLHDKFSQVDVYGFSSILRPESDETLFKSYPYYSGKLPVPLQQFYTQPVIMPHGLWYQELAMELSIRADLNGVRYEMPYQIHGHGQDVLSTFILPIRTNFALDINDYSLTMRPIIPGADTGVVKTVFLAEFLSIYFEMSISEFDFVSCPTTCVHGNNQLDTVSILQYSFFPSQVDSHTCQCEHNRVSYLLDNSYIGEDELYSTSIVKIAFEYNQLANGSLVDNLLTPQPQQQQQQQFKTQIVSRVTAELTALFSPFLLPEHTFDNYMHFSLIPARATYVSNHIEMVFFLSNIVSLPQTLSAHITSYLNNRLVDNYVISTPETSSSSHLLNFSGLTFGQLFHFSPIGISIDRNIDPFVTDSTGNNVNPDYPDIWIRPPPLSSVYLEPNNISISETYYYYRGSRPDLHSLSASTYPNLISLLLLQVQNGEPVNLNQQNNILFKDGPDHNYFYASFQYLTAGLEDYYSEPTFAITTSYMFSSSQLPPDCEINSHTWAIIPTAPNGTPTCIGRDTPADINIVMNALTTNVNPLPPSLVVYNTGLFFAISSLSNIPPLPSLTFLVINTVSGQILSTTVTPSLQSPTEYTAYCPECTFTSDGQGAFVEKYQILVQINQINYRLIPKSTQSNPILTYNMDIMTKTADFCPPCTTPDGYCAFVGFGCNRLVQIGSSNTPSKWHNQMINIPRIFPPYTALGRADDITLVQIYIVDPADPDISITLIPDLNSQTLFLPESPPQITQPSQRDVYIDVHYNGSSQGLRSAKLGSVTLVPDCQFISEFFPSQACEPSHITSCNAIAYQKNNNERFCNCLPDWYGYNCSFDTILGAIGLTNGQNPATVLQHPDVVDVSIHLIDNVSPGYTTSVQISLHQENDDIIHTFGIFDGLVWNSVHTISIQIPNLQIQTQYVYLNVIVPYTSFSARVNSLALQTHSFRLASPPPLCPFSCAPSSLPHPYTCQLGLIDGTFSTVSDSLCSGTKPSSETFNCFIGACQNSGTCQNGQCYCTGEWIGADCATPLVSNISLLNSSDLPFTFVDGSDSELGTNLIKIRWTYPGFPISFYIVLVDNIGNVLETTESTEATTYGSDFTLLYYVPSLNDNGKGYQSAQIQFRRTSTGPAFYTSTPFTIYYYYWTKLPVQCPENYCMEFDMYGEWACLRNDGISSTDFADPTCAGIFLHPPHSIPCSQANISCQHGVCVNNTFCQCNFGFFGTSCDSQGLTDVQITLNAGALEPTDSPWVNWTVNLSQIGSAMIQLSSGGTVLQTWENISTYPGQNSYKLQLDEFTDGYHDAKITVFVSIQGETLQGSTFEFILYKYILVDEQPVCPPSVCETNFKVPIPQKCLRYGAQNGPDEAQGCTAAVPQNYHDCPQNILCLNGGVCTSNQCQCIDGFSTSDCSQEPSFSSLNFSPASGSEFVLTQLTTFSFNYSGQSARAVIVLVDPLTNAHIRQLAQFDPTTIQEIELIIPRGEDVPVGLYNIGVYISSYSESIIALNTIGPFDFCDYIWTLSEPSPQFCPSFACQEVSQTQTYSCTRQFVKGENYVEDINCLDQKPVDPAPTECPYTPCKNSGSCSFDGESNSSCLCPLDYFRSDCSLQLLISDQNWHPRMVDISFTVLSDNISEDYYSEFLIRVGELSYQLEYNSVRNMFQIPSDITAPTGEFDILWHSTQTGEYITFGAVNVQDECAWLASQNHHCVDDQVESCDALAYQLQNGDVCNCKDTFFDKFCTSSWGFYDENQSNWLKTSQNVKISYLNLDPQSIIGYSITPYLHREGISPIKLSIDASTPSQLVGFVSTIDPIQAAGTYTLILHVVSPFGVVSTVNAEDSPATVQVVDTECQLIYDNDLCFEMDGSENILACDPTQETLPTRTAPLCSCQNGYFDQGCSSQLVSNSPTVHSGVVSGILLLQTGTFGSPMEPFSSLELIRTFPSPADPIALTFTPLSDLIEYSIPPSRPAFIPGERYSIKATWNQYGLLHSTTLPAFDIITDCEFIGDQCSEHTETCNLNSQTQATPLCNCKPGWYGFDCSTPLTLLETKWYPNMAEVEAQEPISADFIDGLLSFTLNIGSEPDKFVLTGFSALGLNIPLGVHDVYVTYSYIGVYQNLPVTIRVKFGQINVISDCDWLIYKKTPCPSNASACNGTGYFSPDSVTTCTCPIGYFGSQCDSSLVTLTTSWNRRATNIPFVLNSPPESTISVHNVGYFTLKMGDSSYPLIIEVDPNQLNTLLISIDESVPVPIADQYTLTYGVDSKEYVSSQKINIISDCLYLQSNNLCSPQFTTTCNLDSYLDSTALLPYCTCAIGHYGNDCSGALTLEQIVMHSKSKNIVIENVQNTSQIEQNQLNFFLTKTPLRSQLEYDSKSNGYNFKPSDYGILVPDSYLVVFNYPFRTALIENSLTTIYIKTDVDYLHYYGVYCSPTYTATINIDDLNNPCSCNDGHYGQFCELQIEFNTLEKSSNFELFGDSKTIQTTAIIQLSVENNSPYPTQNGRVYSINLYSITDTNPVPSYVTTLLQTNSLLTDKTVFDFSTSTTLQTIYPLHTSQIQTAAEGTKYFFNIVSWLPGQKPTPFPPVTLSPFYSTPIMTVTRPNLIVTRSELRVETRTVEIDWIVPQRDTSVFTNTLHYSFYLYPSNTNSVLISEALSIISCSVQLTESNRVTKLFNNIYSIPGTVTNTLTLNIPNLPALQGFRIVIRPTDIPTAIPSTDPTIQPVVIMVDKSLPSVCSNKCASTGTCNVYSGECKCETGYFGADCSSTIAPSNDACKLTCPGFTTPSSNCQQCICTTQLCSQYTRVSMVYLTPSSDSANIDTISSYSTSFITNLLRNYINRALFLNKIPLLSSYTGQPLYSMSASEDTRIGYESVHTLPLAVGSTDLRGVSLFLTIQPFVNTSPSQKQIDARFEALITRLRTILASNSPHFVPISTHSVLFSPTTISTTRPAPNWKLLTSTPGATDILQTVCKHQSLDQWSTCLIIPTSPQWSLCPNPITAIGDRFLTVACNDYLGMRWVPSGTDSITSSWCSRGHYNNFPPTLQLTNSCIPPNTEKPPAKPTTLTKPVLSVGDNDSIAAGSSMTVSWNYDGPETSTVSIFLTGITMASSTAIDTSDSYPKFDQMSLLPTNITKSHFIQQYENEFDPLQTFQMSYLLGSFPAVLNTARVTIPARTLPSTSADVRLMVTQMSNVEVLAKSNRQNYLSITTSILCQSVQCQDTMASCDKYTGSCVCPASYQFPPNTLDTLSGVCQLTCAGLCQNGTECLYNQDKKQATCDCGLTGFSGDYCQNNTGCQQSLCNNHGFIINEFKDNKYLCTTQCQCNDKWRSSPGLANGSSEQCKECKITLPDINDGGICDQIGTKIDVTKQECNKCICKDGYSGSRCETRALIGTISFQKNETISLNQSSMISDEVVYQINNTNQYDYDIDHFNQPDSLSTQSSPITALAAIIPPPTTKVTTITLPSANQAQMELDMALSMGVDPALVSLVRVAETTTTTPTSPTQGYKVTTTATTFSITSATTSSPSSQSGSGLSMDDLYSSWSNLQDNFNNLPISKTPAAESLGVSTPPKDPYDPNCDPTINSNCPKGENPLVDPIVPEPPESTGKSNTGAIVAGVVVSLLVILLVIGIAGLLKYSHDRKIWCFAVPAGKSGSDSTTGGTEMSIATQTSSTANDKDSNVKSRSTTFDFGKDQKSKDLMEEGSKPTKATIDLIVMEDDSLPEGWSKHRHATTGEILYTNEIEMKSQKNHPNEKESDGGNGW